MHKLKRLSTEFTVLGEAQEVSRRFEDRKVLVHPQLGSIEVDCQALLTEDESQVLLALTAAPRSEAEGKLKLLTVLGTQEFSSESESAQGTGPYARTR